YDFFQYWRNVGDADVIKCLKMLTFLPIEQIEEMEQHLDSGAAYNNAKETLAYELTALVHGEEEAARQREAARAIFAGGGVSADMPTTELTADDLTDGQIGLLTILVKTKLCPSISEARRLVQQGGVTVNDEKVTDPKTMYTLSEDLIIKKGKKVFHKVTMA
ncbi:MAG: tyrosine--tRNA ligase, partial [Oscillospiraceae bacterium]|nr:tyrosine--tRNA ligase [Oscillospiraceae bacterium]